jgi:hypothetical protein
MIVTCNSNSGRILAFFNVELLTVRFMFGNPPLSDPLTLSTRDFDYIDSLYVFNETKYVMCLFDVCYFTDFTGED